METFEPKKTTLTETFLSEIYYRGRKGIPFVIAGPSGVGKTAISELLSEDESLIESISFTTRYRREGEVNGKHYHFVTMDQFFKKVRGGDFVEYAQVHGDWYGTSKAEIGKNLNQGKDIFLVLDIQGSESMKKTFSSSVTIFMLPPSMEELRSRLELRGNDNFEKIDLRIKNAKKEIEFWSSFDYTIVNEDILETYENVMKIIIAERQKSSLRS